jgi:hypothetical protein
VGEVGCLQWLALMPRVESTGYWSQEGEGCDCGPLMRGIELRGGRAGHRGSIVSVGERGRCTWRERCIREAAAQAPAQVGKGGGKGSAVGGPAQQVGHSTGWVEGHGVERSNRPMGRLGRN